jgi:hypothetical protein
MVLCIRTGWPAEGCWNGRLSCVLARLAWSSSASRRNATASWGPWKLARNMGVSVCIPCLSSRSLNCLHLGHSSLLASFPHPVVEQSRGSSIVCRLVLVRSRFYLPNYWIVQLTTFFFSASPIPRHVPAVMAILLLSIRNAAPHHPLALPSDYRDDLASFLPSLPSRSKYKWLRSQKQLLTEPQKLNVGTALIAIP